MKEKILRNKYFHSKMTQYTFVDNPDESLILSIRREYNENVPPHERYEWTRCITIENKPTYEKMSVAHTNEKCTVFTFKSGDVLDTDRCLYNERNVIDSRVSKK